MVPGLIEAVKYSWLAKMMFLRDYIAWPTSESSQDLDAMIDQIYAEESGLV